LSAQMPPIEKMDASLTNLKACVKLSLSSNTIEKFANLNGLTNLKILCLARNNIKNLNGLDSIGQTLGMSLFISIKSSEYDFIILKAELIL